MATELGEALVTDRTASPRHPDFDRAVAAIAVAGVLAAVAVAVVAALSRTWTPVSDWAVIDEQVRSVGGSGTPLVGAFSRYGWRHPGPWPTWILAVPYRAAGGSPNGILVGAGLVNASAIVGLSWTAFRRAGLALLLPALLAVSGFVHAVGPGLLVDPWNPWMAFLPFLWFLFVVWDALCGGTWSVPLAIGLGSYVVQCHVGYGVPVAVLVGMVVVWLLRRRRSPARRPDGADRLSRSAVVATAIVVLVFWLPVVVEQLTQSPGNLSGLWEFFVVGRRDGLATGESEAGFVTALDLLGAHVVGLAPWITGSDVAIDPAAVTHGPLEVLVPLGLLFLVGDAAWHKRRRDVLMAVIVAAVAMVAAYVAVARLVGAVYPWLIRFTWAVSMFVDVVIVWGVVTLLADRASRLPGIRRAPVRAGRAVAVLALLALLGVNVVTARDTDRVGLPDEETGVAARAVVPTAEHWLAANGARRVSVTSRGEDQGVVSAALVDGLADAGFEVEAPDVFGSHFGPRYTTSGEPVDVFLAVVAGDAYIVEAARRPGAQTIARFTPSPEDGSVLAPVAVVATRRDP